VRRRDLLTSAASFLISTTSLRAQIIHGALPWRPEAGSPPDAVFPGAWKYFTSEEAAAVEALSDRIIPADPKTPGGKDVGCAVFVDRQLAGPYGRQEGLYTKPPFMKGSPQQGPQSSDGPAAQYRSGLAALDRYCRKTFAGRRLSQLDPTDQDKTIAGLEDGSVKLDGGVDAKQFFELFLKDIQAGFFADPIYGGNRDMAAWKMIGFPGARYDYLDWVDRHNERYPSPPVGLAGSISWNIEKK
jgi:gluconate 2-dehydrogenase gamma chain